MWKYINLKTTMRTGPTGIPDLYKDETNKNMTKNDIEKAETLSNFFASVYVQEPDTTDIPQLDNVDIKYDMQDVLITEEVIAQQISKLDSNKSCGPDGIHPKLLKSLLIAFNNF